MRTRIFGLAVALVGACVSAAWGGPSGKTAANVMVELSFTDAKERADPFNEVTLEAIFTEPGGKERRVPAFWDGGKTWKVRYASPVVGEHKYRTECSDAADAALQAQEGAVEVGTYAGDNPLYVHGPLRVAKGSRYMEHLDGTPFLWMGDTWWMGLTKRLGWPEEFQTLAADRKKKGFNLVQIVAGLYPDMPAFDERGANEAGLPWEKDYARIRPEYFDAADKKILYLVEQGFVPCVVGTWGYHLPWLGEKRMEQHERYVYARWGALPMVWCLAGEVNLPFYTSPEFSQPWEKQAALWRPVFAYCRSINCFDRLITAHPSGADPTSTRDVMKDDKLIDVDMLQTPHGQMEVLGTTVATVRFAYGLKPPMPVVNAEPSYEMLFDRTPAEIARLMFWVSWMNGVKGYTYGANGIWQVNGKVKPYGKSPHGGDYGHIPWEQAMNLAGSTQVTLGKKLLAEYEWQRFEPRPDWAAWPAAAAELPLGDWIWFPEGDPAAAAPVAARYFRRGFDLPKGAKVRRAALQVAADDRCTVWLNGQEIGSGEGWQTLKRFDDLASKIRPDRNMLAVRAENVKADVAANPAGLIFGMLVELEDGTRVEVKSDGNGLCATDQTPNWQQTYLLDADWSQTKVVAKYGGAPWGRITGAPADSIVPYAMGIDRQTRMIYVPQARAVAVKELEPGVQYEAFYFDPVTGARSPGPDVKPDPSGAWRVEPPPYGHDWVLVLSARK